MKSPNTLIFGSAPALLDTRRMVMEHSGFKVTVSLDLEETKRLLTTQMFDLLILCHSLSFRDSEKALTLAHMLRPSMKNLILATDFSGHSDDGSDTVLTAFCSPQALISKAAFLTAYVSSSSPI